MESIWMNIKWGGFIYSVWKYNNNDYKLQTVEEIENMRERGGQNERTIACMLVSMRVSIQ